MKTHEHAPQHRGAAEAVVQAVVGESGAEDEQADGGVYGRHEADERGEAQESLPAYPVGPGGGGESEAERDEPLRVAECAV